VQNLVRKHERKRQVQRPVHGWEGAFEINHKEIVGKKVCTGFIWLRLVPVAGMNTGIFGFHKWPGTLRLAGKLIASQDLVDLWLCITVEQGRLG
jgi:hypothetical protein